MSAFDFDAALNTDLSEVEKPPVLPLGYYEWTILGVPELDNSNEDWAFLRVKCGKPVPDDTVDPDELEEFEKEAGPVINQVLTKTFVLNKAEDAEGERNRTMFQVRKFFEEACGIEPGKLSEVMQNAANMTFLGQVKHRPNKQDPTDKFAEIGSTKAVD